MSKKLKPHSDLDFVNHDKVFCQNDDDTISYFELYYEQEMGAWMLVQYEDKTFSQPLKNEDGLEYVAFLYEYGYDLLERCEDYDFEELD